MRRRTFAGIVVFCLVALATGGCFGATDDHPEDEDPLRVRGETPPGSGSGEGAILDRPGTTTKTSATVESFDGHMVPITIYQPTWAGPEDPAPVILHGHGWAGSRETADDAFEDFARGGFGVVTIDMRGHGEARQSSEARVMNMEYEIRDVVAVIDHIATLDWVLLDGPGDPRLGATGGSYGGAYQLLTAAVDERLDAMVPEITWHDLPEALAPDGALKSAWIDILYGAGAARARLAPEIHHGLLWAHATNEIPNGDEPGEPDIHTAFLASSPRSHPFNITIPTLLIQGANDTLFPLNHAVHNYRQIASTGAPVRLVTHFGGHILNTNGTLSDVPSPQPVGLQPRAGPSPCGDLELLAITWLQKHLLDADVDTGPAVCLAVDEETVVRAPALPWSLAPTPADSELVVSMASPNQRAEAKILTAQAAMTLAGVPYLMGNATSTTPDTIVYFTLEVRPADGEAYTANAQVTPMRLGDAVDGQPFLREMTGVSLPLEAGDELWLVGQSTHPQYAHNQARAAGTVTVEGASVWLPAV